MNWLQKYNYDIIGQIRVDFEFTINLYAIFILISFENVS